MRFLKMVVVFLVVPLLARASDWQEGAIIRGPTNSPRMALVFTGHEFGEQTDAILDALKARRISASFFLTGDFLANTNFAGLIQRIIKEGHYLGPHSDKHLLYCSWENPPKLQVSRERFLSDLTANISKIETLGVASERIKYFLPAYEHYNADIAAWTKQAGRILVNYTPGTRSTADYTREQDRNFVPSDKILKSIRDCAQTNRFGLNGFILLLHAGAGPDRADKFSRLFPDLLDLLRRQKYQCVRIDDLLDAK